MKLTPDQSIDRRKRCLPDVVFISGSQGAVVDLKNYESGSYLSKEQVEKTAKDMKALKRTHPTCQTVRGYIYVTKNTKVSPKVEEYAKESQIEIHREGDIDADTLAKIIYAIVTIGMCIYM